MTPESAAEIIVKGDAGPTLSYITPAISTYIERDTLPKKNSKAIMIARMCPGKPLYNKA